MPPERKIHLSVIKAKTLDRRIVFVSAPEITSGDENLNIFALLLDPSWQIQDAEYFINFFTSNEKEGTVKKLDIQDRLGICVIPNKVVEKEGSFYLGLYAKAPDGMVKTSAIAQYRVGKGIETGSTVQDIMSMITLKNKFISLINANTSSSLLSPEMDFDNEIDPIFTNFMSRLHAITSDYNAFLDSIFYLIHRFINDEAEAISDITFAPITYYIVLFEYLKNSVPKVSYDSVNDELDISNEQNEQLQAELDQKTQTLDNLISLFVNLYIGGDTNSNS